MQANLILTDHDDKDEIRALAGAFESPRRLGERTRADVSVSRDPRCTCSCSGHRMTRRGSARTTTTLATFADKGFSDIQEQQPATIEDLECTC